VNANPRLTLLVVAALALTASACRVPVFFPEFEVDADQDAVLGASIARDGEFVVSWDNPDFNIFARRFSRTTSPHGLSFPVNENTLGIHNGGSIARDAEGRFIIVWSESNSLIMGQRWNADGTPIGGNFQVNQSTIGLSSPRVASDPSGNFVVTWSADPHVLARRFDSHGAALGDEFEVAEYTTGTHYATGVAMSTAGFVVTWTGVGEDGVGPFGRVFDGTGASI
jgi:hypothetical protein